MSLVLVLPCEPVIPTTRRLVSWLTSAPVASFSVGADGVAHQDRRYLYRPLHQRCGCSALNRGDSEVVPVESCPSDGNEQSVGHRQSRIHERFTTEDDLAVGQVCQLTVGDGGDVGQRHRDHRVTSTPSRSRTLVAMRRSSNGRS